MTVNISWYTNRRFKYMAGSGLLNFSHSFFVILLTKNGSADPSAISVSDWKEYITYHPRNVSDGYNLQQFELSSSGTNYATSGAALNNSAYTDISTTFPVYKWDADDVVWTNLNTTGTNGIYGFAIYDRSQTIEGQNPIMAVGMFDTVQSFTTQNFTISFSPDGIMQI